jgi:hypothetical protein
LRRLSIGSTGVDDDDLAVLAGHAPLEILLTSESEIRDTCPMAFPDLVCHRVSTSVGGNLEHEVAAG